MVRSIVHKALDYGVPENQILGIRYGFRGFYSKEHRPIVLTRRAVDDIHLDGGTMLGTSRGGADVREIVKRYLLAYCIRGVRLFPGHLAGIGGEWATEECVVAG